MTELSVLGAGSFGTALAIQLARREQATQIWGRNAEHMAQLAQQRVNQRYLPDCKLPVSLKPQADLQQAVSAAQHLVVAVPSHAFRDTLQAIAPLLADRQGIACACKGLEPETGKLPHEVFEDVLGQSRPFAVISGPTFAKEIGIGLPTAVTVASADEAFAEFIADAFHGGVFRAYTATDVAGVEIGGAVKNVLAIGVGIADGLQLGANTRAALITRGLAEIMRLGEALGGNRDTLMGLAGMGDLVLTCTDNQSRNRRMGLALASGKSVAAACEEIQQVVEGVRVAPEVQRLARRLNVEMPITEQVVRILSGEATPVEGVKALAGRPQKAEAE